MAASTKITERGTDGIAVEALIPASQPGDVFPAGAMLHYAGSAAPSGWLICDGSAVSRATYPQLFANIGTTFGAGDGSTTFNLPDTRGKIPVGKHTSGTFVTLGASGGEENHVLVTAEMPSHTHTGPSHTHTIPNHTHTLSDPGHTHSGMGNTNQSAGNGQGYAAGAFYTNQVMVSAVSHSTSTQTTGISVASSGGGGATSASGTGATGAAGSGSAHNNMPPYMVLNHIIRAY